MHGLRVPLLSLVLIGAGATACSEGPAGPGAGGAGTAVTSTSGAGAGASTTSSAGGAGAGGAGTAGYSGGFVDLTAAIPPPFDVPSSPADAPLPWELDTGGLLADLDGDGISEVVLTHVSPPPGPLPGDTTPKQYRYEGGALVLVGAFTTPGAPPATSLPRALVDIDGDGYPDALTSAQIGWGKAGGGFETFAFFTGASVNRGPVDTLDIADIDGDGWLDLIIGGAACAEGMPPLFPLTRTGSRTFVQRDDLVVQPNPGRSFTVVSTSFEGKSVVGSLYSPCLDGLPDPVPFYGQDGAQFTPFGVLPPGYVLNAPMGAARGDLDGDGLFDFTISEHPNHSYFSGATLPLTDVTPQTGLSVQPAASLVPMIPWGVAFVDLDRDGRLDVVTTHGNDFSAWFTPGYQVGPQWVTTHLNQGGFAFQEVNLGLGREGQWKTLTVGDLEGDGDPDLIVGGGAEPPRVYRNDIVGGHAMSLALRGSTSNSLGMGAIVDVWPTDDASPQRYLAGSLWGPNVFSEPLVFVGLGSNAVAARVRITWPSGTVQELVALAGDKLHVVHEPPVLAVEPAGRHVAAGGAAVASVHVTPRSPDGAIRAGVVTASIDGDGTVASITPEGDGWLVSIAPSEAPGSGVVTVDVDGVPVGVHPRLFWE